MDKSKEIDLLNRHSPAFVTDFRFYPTNKYDNQGRSFFEQELHDITSKEFTMIINEYNQKIAQHMIEDAEQNGTSMISYTDNYKTT